MAADINVLIVDDSAFMRRIIADILEQEDDIKVIGTAREGSEAVEKVKSLNPDVITLDVEMPGMDGISCLKELQKVARIPVIMLSSKTKNGEKSTIEALENGAIDFVTKPTDLFGITGDIKKQELIEKIRMAKSIGTGRSASRNNPVRQIRQLVVQKTDKSSSLKTIVAIGTSTGGPKALQEVIPKIPGSIPAAVLIVQHMPPGFTKSLAERLNQISELTVKEAEDGEAILPGYAYIAPGDYHMEVSAPGNSKYAIRLTQDPLVGGHRPSVNVMMNSLARSAFPGVVGVIMTGMGSDGSDGITSLKKASNARIISQDEKSCVVYGMPRAAVLTGTVDQVVPLKGIADEIVKNLGV